MVTNLGAEFTEDLYPSFFNDVWSSLLPAGEFFTLEMTQLREMQIEEAHMQCIEKLLGFIPVPQRSAKLIIDLHTSLKNLEEFEGYFADLPVMQLFDEFVSNFIYIPADEQLEALQSITYTLCVEIKKGLFFSEESKVGFNISLAEDVGFIVRPYLKILLGFMERELLIKCIPEDQRACVTSMIHYFFEKPICEQLINTKEDERVDFVRLVDRVATIWYQPTIPINREFYLFNIQVNVNPVTFFGEFSGCQRQRERFFQMTMKIVRHIKSCELKDEALADKQTVTIGREDPDFFKMCEAIGFIPVDRFDTVLDCVVPCISYLSTDDEFQVLFQFLRHIPKDTLFPAIHKIMAFFWAEKDLKLASIFYFLNQLPQETVLENIEALFSLTKVNAFSTLLKHKVDDQLMDFVRLFNKMPTLEFIQIAARLGSNFIVFKFLLEYIEFYYLSFPKCLIAMEWFAIKAEKFPTFHQIVGVGTFHYLLYKFSSADSYDFVVNLLHIIVELPYEREQTALVRLMAYFISHYPKESEDFTHTTFNSVNELLLYLLSYQHKDISAGIVKFVFENISPFSNNVLKDEAIKTCFKQNLFDLVAKWNFEPHKWNIEPLNNILMKKIMEQDSIDLNSQQLNYNDRITLYYAMHSKLENEQTPLLEVAPVDVWIEKINYHLNIDVLREISEQEKICLRDMPPLDKSIATKISELLKAFFQRIRTFSTEKKLEIEPFLKNSQYTLNEDYSLNNDLLFIPTGPPERQIETYTFCLYTIFQFILEASNETSSTDLLSPQEMMLIGLCNLFNDSGNRIQCYDAIMTNYNMLPARYRMARYKIRHLTNAQRIKMTLFQSIQTVFEQFLAVKKNLFMLIPHDPRKEPSLTATYTCRAPIIIFALKNMLYRQIGMLHFYSASCASPNNAKGGIKNSLETIVNIVLKKSSRHIVPQIKKDWAELIVDQEYVSMLSEHLKEIPPQENTSAYLTYDANNVLKGLSNGGARFLLQQSGFITAAANNGVSM